ncbi:MAG: hypothetical protein WCI17_07065 [bacterium]
MPSKTSVVVYKSLGTPAGRQLFVVLQLSSLPSPVQVHVPALAVAQQNPAAIMASNPARRHHKTNATARERPMTHPVHPVCAMRPTIATTR